MSMTTYDTASLLKFLSTSKRVGLLGGSFNPAHEGHLAVSEYAIKHLDVEYVVWLVAVQNPLKKDYKHNIEARAVHAASIASHNQKIIISTIESEIKNSSATYNVLHYLTTHLPDIEFTWMMGADCVPEFHLWENFDKFLDIVDIAIFDRDEYALSIKSTITYKEFLKKHKHRVIFCNNTKVSVSSSEIRKHSKNYID